MSVWFHTRTPLWTVEYSNSTCLKFSDKQQWVTVRVCDLMEGRCVGVAWPSALMCRHIFCLTTEWAVILNLALTLCLGGFNKCLFVAKWVICSHFTAAFMLIWFKQNRFVTRYKFYEEMWVMQNLPPWVFWVIARMLMWGCYTVQVVANPFLCSCKSVLSGC